ncbi:MAG TPA: GAF domain-containing protein, partial [Anaerolineales bacterium]|nr:GAF domain-containing protein [Anaerolineales bacterium]
LEERVADRTQALAATVAIGQRLASLLDQREIIQEVVDQLQKTFGYYHVHIYLYDKEHKNLKMMGGSGLVGKALFNMGHQIPTGRGLVGRAANANQVVLVSDVSQEAGWLPNPLLPETKSEVAVPIAKGSQVLGVIDVQQTAVNGLTEVDAGLLENIAAQVAVALQNAELFAQVQRNAERQIFLAQVNDKIQNTSDMESALKVAVRELGRALNAKQAFVQLKTTEEKETL